MEEISIELKQSASEAPRIVNVLLGLSTRRQVALLQLLGLRVHPSFEVGLHGNVVLSVAWLKDERIAVHQTSAGSWNWEPLSANESSKEGRLVGVIPDDFCIYLSVTRRVSWESDDIPLDDATDCQFVGDSIRSLLAFMGLKGSVDSSWLQYLSRHPERLDEDLSALREELSSDEFNWDC